MNFIKFGEDLFYTLKPIDFTSPYSKEIK